MEKYNARPEKYSERFEKGLPIDESMQTWGHRIVVGDKNCTCENPNDNLCDFCDERETNEIIAEAKRTADILSDSEKLRDEIKEAYYRWVDARPFAYYSFESFKAGYCATINSKENEK